MLLLTMHCWPRFIVLSLYCKDSWIESSVVCSEKHLFGVFVYFNGLIYFKLLDSIHIHIFFYLSYKVFYLEELKVSHKISTIMISDNQMTCIMWHCFANVFFVWMFFKVLYKTSTSLANVETVTIIVYNFINTYLVFIWLQWFRLEYLLNILIMLKS